MTWNKKGITPLMATLLLVSFAVALGVTIMNFGSAEVEDQAECPINVGLKFSNIGGQEQLCYDQNSKLLKFTLENGVNIKVDGVIVNVIGEVKADSFELNDVQMIKAESYLGKVNYDSSISGMIQQVKISPKVMLYEVEQICTEQALVVENVREC